MKLETRDGTAERRVLIQCLTNTHFLARVVGRIGENPFRSQDSNILWEWSEKHYTKYKKAPQKNLEVIFESWEAHPDKKKGVERLLRSLDSQYQKDNKDVDFSLDIAEKFFNQVRLERLKDELESSLRRGEVEEASNAALAFPKVNLRPTPYTDMLSDKELHSRAFKERHQTLIKYPGAAGVFFGNELAKDSFVAFMGSSKARKSYVLLDIAWRAFMQGRRVAYFQVGDLSKDQFTRRMQTRAMYRPFDAKIVKSPVDIQLPTDHRGLASVEFELKEYEENATESQALKAIERARKRYKGDFHLSYHPIKTISVPDIKNTVRQWSDDGWDAEVVVVDYAGNLSPVSYKMDVVNQVSESWALLRQLSEERKCLVVTAQQSNKEGFSAWVLTRKNFSESKMILAHVTAFLGINQTDEEVGQGITRLNFVVRREGAFRETSCLYLATCLDRADMCVRSAFEQELGTR